MKRLLFFLIFLIIQSNSFTQETERINSKKYFNIEKQSMKILASWSGANIISGSIGWAVTDHESKYFNQMNVVWNIVNLGIAIPSLLRTHPEDLNSEEISARQHKTEKILLLNAGLDAAYITGGFLFKEMSKNNPDNYHRYRGFGNALLLQGGFLLVFDIIQFAVHQKHRNKKESSLSSALSFSNSGVGFCYNF